jgi:RNA polymerase sigma factor (sigma-70 family)
MAATASPHPLPVAQRGDEEALYRAQHKRLLGLIARDVRARPQVIEDACAYAWAELLARQPERTSIVGWLRVVARREAIRLAQRDRATVSMSAIAADGLPHRARSTTCPTSDADEQCEVLEALALVAALPERKRTFLALKVAGFSYDEIAAELGVSWLTVNRQLVRARAAIREARDGDQSRAEDVPERVG